jgi:hypothetical protein
VIGLLAFSGKPIYNLIYAMEITEKLTFSEYWKDERFQVKKVNKNDFFDRNGDNIYEPLSDGGWKQHPSWHTCPKFSVNECEIHKTRDVIKGEYVLISNNFVYFGRKNAISLPPELKDFMTPEVKDFKTVPRYRCFSDCDQIKKWVRFIENLLLSQHGNMAIKRPTIRDDVIKNCIKREGC